uniref:phage tail length tape measure family protein n=1 Tax=Dongia deserti TaxID=2268030 RepID=UPI0025471663
MADLTLGITLKADGTGFVGAVKVSADELKKLGDTGKRAGEQASKGTDLASASLGRLKTAVLGAVTAYASFQTVQRFIGAATREIMAAEKATANLNAVLRATGGTVGFTADELSDMADQLERTTLFDDAAIKQAEAVLLTFRQVQGDTFREAIGLATDLAALMGGDLQGAVLQLGKALEDPVTGLTALRRSGISFTEAQQDLIKSLVETGDQAHAMQIILDTVAGQIGGVATEQVTGLTGALNNLDDAWGDFLKSLADSKAFDVAIAGLRTLTDWINRLNASGLDAVSNEINDLIDERDEIVTRIQQRQNDSVLAGISDFLGVGDDRDTQRLGEIEARLVELQDLADRLMLDKGNQPPKAPPPPVGGGPRGETDAEKQIRKLVEALEFENEQLSRTSEEQQLYNALHAAGVDINSAAGQTIQQLVASIQQKTDAQQLADAAQEAANATMEEGRQLMEAMRTPAEVYADTIEHLGNLLAQKAIDQETFNRAVELADKTLEE